MPALVRPHLCQRRLRGINMSKGVILDSITTLRPCPRPRSRPRLYQRCQSSTARRKRTSSVSPFLHPDHPHPPQARSSATDGRASRRVF